MPCISSSRCACGSLSRPWTEHWPPRRRPPGWMHLAERSAARGKERPLVPGHPLSSGQEHSPARRSARLSVPSFSGVFLYAKGTSPRTSTHDRPPHAASAQPGIMQAPMRAAAFVATRTRRAYFAVVETRRWPAGPRLGPGRRRRGSAGGRPGRRSAHGRHSPLRDARCVAVDKHEDFGRHAGCGYLRTRRAFESDGDG